MDQYLLDCTSCLKVYNLSIPESEVCEGSLNYWLLAEGWSQLPSGGWSCPTCSTSQHDQPLYYN